MNDFETFARLIQAVAPWRAHLVLVGGWAHRLYRLHEMASQQAYQPLTTKDTDLAFDNHAPLHGDIKGALTEAGFNEEFVGDFRPPAIHYTLGDDDAGFYAEFLTPLTGSGLRRSGEQDATMAKAGITAQKLRHLNLLLLSPWTLRIGLDQNIPLPKPMDVQLVNPTSFIVQKLLIRHERRADKRAQDVLYIHDTLELFGDALPMLRELWINAVQPALTPKLVRKLSEHIHETFDSVNDVLREAARIPGDRMLSADRMRALCELALSEVLTNVSV
jgi:hypothetical protein